MIKNLQLIRTKRGLSKEHVGNALGIPASQLSDWETGKTEIPADMLQVLAAYYETDDPSALLEETNDADRMRGRGDKKLLNRTHSSTVTNVQETLHAFREQLQALSKKDLLPLDDDTIEFCVEAMRKQIEDMSDSDQVPEIEVSVDLIKQLHAKKVQSTSSAD